MTGGFMTKHILVADDDPHILEIISFALGKAGMGVTLARDGRQALEAFAARTPDLMVLDINMPEMDGLGSAASSAGLPMCPSSSFPPETTRSTACSVWRSAATTT